MGIYNWTDTCNNLCLKINMTVELRKVSKRSKVIHELYTNPIHLWKLFQLFISPKRRRVWLRQTNWRTSILETSSLLNENCVICTNIFSLPLVLKDTCFTIIYTIYLFSSFAKGGEAAYDLIIQNIKRTGINLRLQF